MIVKAFKVTRPTIALDGSEDNLFRNQHLLQDTEAGAVDHNIDAEQEDEDDEDEDEDPFHSDFHSDSDVIVAVINCLCCCFDKNISWYKLLVSVILNLRT